jgi:hypothetical protein
MKTLMSFAAIIFLASVAVSFAAGEKEAMIEKEKAVWQSVQDKKMDAFRKFFADDYHSAYAEGIFNVDQEVEAVRKTDLKSFSLSDTTVAFPDQDTAVLTYKVNAQGTQEGKDMSGTYNCATIWHKSGTDWKAVFHTEIKPRS